MDPLTAAANRSLDYLHIVLISTGSVASIEIPLIVKEFFAGILSDSAHNTEPDAS